MSQRGKKDLISLDLTALQKEDTHENSNTAILSIYKKFFSRKDINLPRNDPCYQTVQALNLKQKDLRKLKKKFDSMDIDRFGSISYDEIFEILGEKRSPFTDALFALIDTNGSGQIEFCEFVRLCSTYCIYTKEDILRFCFDYFDKDGSGTIDDLEYKALCRNVNGASPCFPGNFKSALTMVDSDNDGLIDFNEFVDLDRRYPLLLFPAFRLQNRMQKVTLGEKAWARILEAAAEAAAVQNYMNTHGGMKPDIPFIKKVKGYAMQKFGRSLHVSVSDIEEIKKRPSAAKTKGKR